MADARRKWLCGAVVLVFTVLGLLVFGYLRAGVTVEIRNTGGSAIENVNIIFSGGSKSAGRIETADSEVIVFLTTDFTD